MAKPQKTAKELEVMMHARADAVGIRCGLNVHPDRAYGWHVKVVSELRLKRYYQLRIDEITAELREQFELKI